MIVINTSEYNGTKKGVNIFSASLIMSGTYIGKFGTSENALNEFPEIFENLTYEIVNLPSSVFQVDTTAPTLYPYAVEILQEYRWVFPENKFILNAFEIPLDTYQSTKVVNLAYFEWLEFRAELDKKDSDGNFVYATLKRSLMPLWDYVALQVQNGNVIVL